MDMARQEAGEKPRKKTPRRADDLGLNYPRDYLLRPFTIWHDSGFQVWPNGRSYDDQDPLLVDDFFALLGELSYQVWALKNPEEAAAAEQQAAEQMEAIPTFQELYG